METTDKKTITWADLKEASNKMSEEQLKNPVFIKPKDEYMKKIHKVLLFKNDIYINKNDDEDFGTLSDLKGIHEIQVLENYTIINKKGTPFLYTSDEWE